jgi:hypothetical protein
MKTAKSALALLAVLLACAPALNAATAYSNATVAGDFNWNDPTTWDTAPVAPASTSDRLGIYIYNGANVTFSDPAFTVPLATTVLAVSNATFNIASGSSISGIDWFGVGGTANVVVGAPPNDISIAPPTITNAPAFVNIESGASLSVGNSLNIGYATTGTLTANSATINANNTYVAGGTSRTGFLILNDSTLSTLARLANAQNIAVGSGTSSNGTLNATNSTILSRGLSIAASNNARGLLSLDNSTLDLSANDVASPQNQNLQLALRSGANATLTASNNSHIIARGIVFGANITTTSTITLTDSELRDTGDGSSTYFGIYIGYGATAPSADQIRTINFTINNSTVYTPRILSIAAATWINATVTLEGASANVTVGGAANIGNGANSTATYRQKNGKTDFKAALSVSATNDTTGNLIVEDGTFSAAGPTSLAGGSKSVANVTVTGGSVTLKGALRSGNGTKSTTNITVSGGCITFGSSNTTHTYFANSTTGPSFANLKITGGSLSTTGHTYLGNGVNSRANITLSSGSVTFGTNTTTSTYLGNNNGSIGNISVSGGNLTIKGNLFAGNGWADGANARGDILLTGGNITIEGSSYFGARNGTTAVNGGKSLITITGGNLSNNGSTASLGYNKYAYTEVLMTGGNFSAPTTSGFFNIGFNGEADVTLSGTANLNVRNTFRMGVNSADSRGSLTLNTGGTATLFLSTSAAKHFIGDNGTAVVNVNGGTLDVKGGTVVAGNQTGSSGTFAVTAGTANFNNLTLAVDGAGALSVSGSGTAAIANTLTLGKKGSVTLTGGSLSAQKLTFALTDAAYTGLLDASAAANGSLTLDAITIDLTAFDASLLDNDASYVIELLKSADASVAALSPTIVYGMIASSKAAYKWENGVMSLLLGAAAIPEPATTAALLSLLALALLLRRRE